MFTWTPEYSVGVKEMDEQHQVFLQIANNTLLIAQEAKPSKDQLLSAAGMLLDYGMYHLKTEEGLMKQFSCLTREHAAAHEMFREKISDFFDRISGDAEAAVLAEVSSEMMTFAGEWLLKHILVMDKGYTKCFNEHGLK